MIEDALEDFLGQEESDESEVEENEGKSMILND